MRCFRFRVMGSMPLVRPSQDRGNEPSILLAAAGNFLAAAGNFALSSRPMCNDYEQRVAWADYRKVMRQLELGIPTEEAERPRSGR